MSSPAVSLRPSGDPFERRPLRPVEAAPTAAAGRVVIVSGSVGAGHDGVAYELARRLTDRGHDVRVLDLLKGFPMVVRVMLSSAYVLTVKLTPWVYEAVCWLVERSRLFQRAADAVCCTASPWLLRSVAGADVVVATYPPAGRALGRLRATGRLTVPVAMYLTDPAPNFLWVHPDLDLHLTMSEATAREAEDRYGVPMQAAGPLVSPAFRKATRRAARRHLLEVAGVGPEQRVAMLVLGSLGIGDVRSALRALRAAGMVSVVLCGRNEQLRSSLAKVPGAVALGWRDDVVDLVTGADLVVHNAGGLSLTESLVAGVPAVTYAALPGHGKANARTLDRSGMAPWAKSPAELTLLARASEATPRAPWPVEDETATDRVCALVAAQLAIREVAPAQRRRAG